MIAPQQLYTTDEILPALRELVSHHHTAASAGPETISRMIYMLHYTNYRPSVFEVEAALEVLVIGGEVAA